MLSSSFFTLFTVPCLLKKILAIFFMRARSEPEPDPNRTLWTGFTEVQVQGQTLVNRTQEVQVQVRQNMPGPRTV